MAAARLDLVSLDRKHYSASPTPELVELGLYEKERDTGEQVASYIANHGLRYKGTSLEVYVSDPRRTRPDRLKTIVR